MRRREGSRRLWSGPALSSVFYGNIGSVDRQDFTVVGPAVNETSRIAAMCQSVDRSVVLSSEFVRRRPSPSGRPSSPSAVARYQELDVRRYCSRLTRPWWRINWITNPDFNFKELFAEGKVDAFLGAPPKSQELRARKIGRVILNTATDQPW